MSITYDSELPPKETSTARKANTPESELHYDDLLAQLTAILRYLDRTYDEQERLTADKLRESIYGGVKWLKTAQEESGHFLYEYIPYEGTYRSDNNMVRQAGALYALGEVMQQNDDDPLRVSDTIQNAIAYFETMSHEGIVGDTTFRCIVRSDASTQCPLGATALALVGILDYVSAYPEKASHYNTPIEGYRMYLLAMQKENGGFIDMFNVRRSTLNEKDMKILWPTNTAYVPYTRDFTTWRTHGAVNYSNPTRNYCAYAEGLASAYTVLKDERTAAELAPLRSRLNRMHARHAALQIGSQDVYRALSEESMFTLQKK